MLLDFLILLHLVLMTYWLGSDIGVFYAAKFVNKPDISLETRLMIRRIMHWVDLLPRMCMVLMLPSGVSLMAAHPRGDVFGWPIVAGAWIIALIWLSAVIYQFRMVGHGDTSTRQFKIVTWTDFRWRIVLVVTLVGSGLYTMLADEPFGVDDTNPAWLGAKVLLYGITIACGLGIRIAAKPGGPAFQRLLNEGPTPEIIATLDKSMKKSLPFVYVIWTLVVVIAFLGVAQPGA